MSTAPKSVAPISTMCLLRVRTCAEMSRGTALEPEQCTGRRCRRRPGMPRPARPNSEIRVALPHNLGGRSEEVRIVILFGSEMGTAEAAAECVADELAVAHDVSVYDMTDFDVDDLDIDAFHIVVCSTYGDGELPTGAEPFFDVLEARKPDLTGLIFAVFGLGDSVYGDTFNRGGELAAELLTARGATQ